MTLNNKLTKSIMMRFKIAVFFCSIIVTACARKNEQKNQAQPAKPNTIDIVAMLDTVWQTEQVPIRKRDSAFQEYGNESDEYKKYQAIYKKTIVLTNKK